MPSAPAGLLRPIETAMPTTAPEIFRRQALRTDLVVHDRGGLVGDADAGRHRAAIVLGVLEIGQPCIPAPQPTYDVAPDHEIAGEPAAILPIRGAEAARPVIEAAESSQRPERLVGEPFGSRRRPEGKDSARHRVDALLVQTG